MIDRVLAALSLAALLAFIGVIVLYVPDADLVIVSAAVLALAAYDFYVTAFRNRRNGR